MLAPLNLKLKKKVRMPSQVFKKKNGKENLRTRKMAVNCRMFDLKLNVQKGICTQKCWYCKVQIFFASDKSAFFTYFLILLLFMFAAC
jgi:coproporphyrinogen III oxidase-like Fe-S oxidoreductase